MKKWSVNRLMQAAMLCRIGMSYNEIARRLGVTEQELIAHLPEMREYGMEKI